MSGLRARLARTSGDQGFGLPEMLIAMFLFAVISALVLTLITTFSRTFTQERSAVDSTNVAAIGMNELTRVIRSGTEIRVDGNVRNRPVFLHASSDQVTLHAFLDTDSINPAPIKVRFRIDGDRQLIEERWNAEVSSDPFWTFGAENRDPDTGRPVARQIPAGGASMFTFRTAEVCAPAAPDCNVLTPPTGGSLSEDDRRRIAVVEIRLTVQADVTERADPVTIQNQVGLPNLGIDRVGASQ